jgi:hypothetical protein
MPPRGWTTLSVREEVKKQLEELASKLGMASLNDVVSYLLDKYREFTEISVRPETLLTDLSVKLTDISVKLEKHLTSISSKVDELLTRVSSIATSNASISTSGKTPATSNSSSLEPGQHAAQSSVKAKPTAWDILKRDKVSCMSDIKARNPVRVIEALFRGGAVKIDLGHDVCVVEPSFWWEFWHTLQNVKTPDDNEVLSYLKSEKMRQLFTRLRSPQQLIYLDAKSRSWVYDAEHIEIPREALEATRSSEKEEHYEPEDLYR